MIIVFKQNTTVEEKTKLKNQLESKGFQIHASDGVNASLFGVVGDTSALDINLLRVVEGVEKVMRVQEPFKRANRMFHPDDSIIDVAAENSAAKSCRLSQVHVPLKLRSRLRKLPRMLRLQALR